MTLIAIVVLFGAVFVTCTLVYGEIDRRERGEAGPSGRHRSVQLTEAELHEFATAARASLFGRHPAPDTPVTGIIRMRPRVEPVVEVVEPLVDVDDSGPIGPFVPGMARRLAPRTIPTGMRLEAPTATCRTCTGGGLVAGGRCIVCGNDEMPVYRNGVHK